MYFQNIICTLNKKKYLLQQKETNESILFYNTHDSFKRDKRILIRLLSTIPNINHQIIWCAPIHKDIIEEIQNHPFAKQLIWIHPSNFYQKQLNLKFLKKIETTIVYDQKTLNYFINSIIQKTKFQIQIHPSIQTNSKLFFEIQKNIHKILEHIARRIKTINHFSKVWKTNYSQNKNFYSKVELISKKLNIQIPKTIILGGSSSDKVMIHQKFQRPIWCADTALYPLIKNKIIPDLVISIDSSRYTLDHFIKINMKNISKVILIIDPLGCPSLFAFPFKKIYTYKSSNPLLKTEKELDKAIQLQNIDGTTFGLIKALYKLLFLHDIDKDKEIQIYGNDQYKNINYLTHIRGSSYYWKNFMKTSRISTIEEFFFNLSLRLQK